ncbi:MAG: NAD-dependent epimerase/dehydratase family protein [Rhabdochlamydiaceae bacterium]|nr:NAD-dependent epimerase/dehydratase family protein [Candidatus Amphrikana amoebophyrae]
MRVLISGISCSLGAFTAQMLVKQGYQVRGFSRSIPKDKIVGVEYIPCDLNSNQLEKIVMGCDLIVHIAALSSPWGKKDDFYKVNVEGTCNLLKFALKHKVKRFIYISSPSIYFNYQNHHNISESYRSKKAVNHYAASKLEAEKHVKLASDMGLETFILRPKAIFGPGDSVLLPRMIKALNSTGIPRFTKEDILLDITYVENVAQAIALTLIADKKYCSSAYNITNGSPVHAHLVIKELLQVTGHTYREKKINYYLAKSVAYIAEFASKFTRVEPRFTRYSVGSLAFSQTLSLDKAKKELGYVPIISVEEGIKRYKEWWYENLSN